MNASRYLSRQGVENVPFSSIKSLFATQSIIPVCMCNDYKYLNHQMKTNFLEWNLNLADSIITSWIVQVIKLLSEITYLSN